MTFIIQITNGLFEFELADNILDHFLFLLKSCQKEPKIWQSYLYGHTFLISIEVENVEEEMVQEFIDKALSAYSPDPQKKFKVQILQKHSKR